MFTFLHISDLHIHGCHTKNQRVAQRLQHLLIEVQSQPDCYLLITGDLTDDGTEAQYQRARELLLPFPASRLLVCPGNHDNGPLGLFYSESSAAHFPEYCDYHPVVHYVRSQRGEQAMLIGLNATLPTVSPHDLSRGELGVAQLNLLDSLLSQRSVTRLPKLVYLHFNPFEGDPTLALGDAEELLGCLRYRVSVVCWGHSHRLECRTDEPGLPILLSAGACCNESADFGFRFRMDSRGCRELCTISDQQLRRSA